MDVIAIYWASIFFVSYSAEQTSGYAPPEAFLNVSWYKGPSSVTSKYVGGFLFICIFRSVFFSKMDDQLDRFSSFS